MQRALLVYIFMIGVDFMNKWFTALVTAIAAAASYLLGVNQ